MKDPIGMLGDSLESIILLKSVLGDDFNLPQSLDSIWPKIGRASCRERVYDDV